MEVWTIPESPLARKLKLKSGASAVIVDPPDGYLAELRPLPDGVSLSDKLQGSFDWIQIFVKNKAVLEKVLARATKALKPVSILWISFPRGDIEDPDRSDPGQRVGGPREGRLEVGEPRLGKRRLVGICGPTLQTR